MRPVARSSVALLTAAALFLGVAAIAVAKDTHAPAKAGDRWLPCEPWVMFHWLPFDAEKLYSATGTTRRQWHDYILDDDHHTLEKFIENRGGDPEAVIDQLMTRWKGRVSDAKFNELSRRAHELLTQGHLAQHVFFHYFHHPMLGIRARYIFNVSPSDYHAARMAGFTPREIAKHGGVPLARAVRRALKVLRESQEEAITSGQTQRAQSRAFLKQERGWVKTWLKQSIRPRQKHFPHGTKKITGTRDQQACEHMVGPVHVKGDNGLSMYCDLRRRPAASR